MAKRKPKKSSAEAAVLVSYHMQFYTVVAAFSAVVFQALFFIMTSGIHSFHTTSFRQIAPLLATTIVFPVIIFLIAFFSSRQYQVPISRWFIAVVKSIIAIILFSTLQSIWSWVTLSIYNPSKYYRTAPPEWVTSSWPMYLTMLLVIAAMIVVVYGQKKKA